MIWIVYALPGLAIIYLAARFSRFRRFAEPILSIAAASGLLIAFWIWFNDGNAKPQAEAPFSPAPAITADDLVLSDLTYTRARPETSYRVAGTIRNDSNENLDYFRLAVTLEDCPDAQCVVVGSDTALILARVLAGKSMPFETFFTIPNPTGAEPSAPKWSYRVTDVKARVLPSP